MENKVGNSYVDTLSSFNTKKKYDVIFTSHTNYYWSLDEMDYQKQLDKLISMLKKGGKLLILTLPAESDHYKIMMKQVYPKFDYSKYIVDYYKKKVLVVGVRRFKMRMFIGDILKNNNFFDLNNLYRFIHNTSSYPNVSESKRFLGKIRKFQKKGYLDFKDELIIVEN